MSGQEFDNAYQRPLPGLEHLGADKTLPVGHIFKHPEIERHPAEYSLTMNYLPKVLDVRTSALRPTQRHLDEAYLHSEDRRGPEPMDHELPGAIKDRSGRYRMVDGHHHVARNMLNGQQFTRVQVWHA